MLPEVEFISTLIVPKLIDAFTSIISGTCVGMAYHSHNVRLFVKNWKQILEGKKSKTLVLY